MNIKNILTILALFSSINLFCMDETSVDFSDLSKTEFEKLVIEEINKGNFNIIDKNGNTFLHWIALNDYTNILNNLLNGVLLQHISIPSLCNIISGYLEGDIDLSYFLNAKNKDGRTPLICAAIKNSTYIANLLIEGTNLDIQDKDDMTALMWAARKNSQELIKLLIEKGADTTLKDKNNKTLFHHIESLFLKKKSIELIQNRKSIIQKEVSNIIPVKDLANIVVNYL